MRYLYHHPILRDWLTKAKWLSKQHVVYRTCLYDNKSNLMSTIRTEDGLSSKRIGSEFQSYHKIQNKQEQTTM